MTGETCDVLVIGGGPAGLRAAELTAQAGLHTIVADRMPSVGRKLLVAGKGGLNLTHSEPLEAFIHRYGDDARWRNLLRNFSPDDLRAWARGLGIETFIGTSGRVFPESKQAAPLLRRWVARLKQQGVEFRLRHEWRGLGASGSSQVLFQTPCGPAIVRPRVTILACGGASWPQTGSNAAWVPLLRERGIEVTPLAPANCGYEVVWPPDFLAEAEGRPLKNIAVWAGGMEVRGELLVTRYGLEGGALYQLSRTLRNSPAPAVTIDLKPDFTAGQLVAKLRPASHDLLEGAARAWKLGPVAKALLRLASVSSADALATQAKQFHLRLGAPRPIEEAISSAGGVAWDELDPHFMLRQMPAVFCAGEMIDWEAPTGGYLLQGSFATGTRAAWGAVAYLDGSKNAAARKESP